MQKIVIEIVIGFLGSSGAFLKILTKIDKNQS